jgi:hypothetical protein
VLCKIVPDRCNDGVNYANKHMDEWVAIHLLVLKPHCDAKVTFDGHIEVSVAIPSLFPTNSDDASSGDSVERRQLVVEHW